MPAELSGGANQRSGGRRRRLHEGLRRAVIGAFEPGAERRMAERPAIVILDDEPVALSALLDALARRFGSDYRVVSHLTADACLAALAAMKSASEEVALIVADQWMPGMTGSELLARAHRIFPAAKRALLVAWGDRTAAPTILQSCAFGEIDNYLYKPWSPAEVHLYPLVSEFLAEWTRAFRPGLELVKVIAASSTPRPATPASSRAAKW